MYRHKCVVEVHPDQMETQLCPILMGMAPEVEMVQKPTHRRQADKDWDGDSN